MSNSIAIINRDGYVFNKKYASKELLELIKNELIVKPELDNDYKTPESFKIYTEDTVNFYLPRDWAIENIDIDPVIKFKFNKNSIYNFKFKGIIRNQQIDVIESLINIYYDHDTNRLKSYAGTIINVPTGMGKTVMAIWAISFLKRKTIIFCHTSNLVIQWTERLEQYLETSKIGYIKGDKVNIKGCNIVIAMIQTVMTNKKDYKNLLKNFDFVIYDEVHHMACKVFSTIMRIIQTPYALGLSATLNRPDKLEKVFKWSIGPVGYKSEGSLDYDIDVRVYKYNTIDNPKFKMLANRYTKRVKISLMMTNLTEIETRNNMIVKIIQDVFTESPNRHLVLISNRIQHLQTLKELLQVIFPDQVALYIGKMTPAELKIAETKKIILASYNLMQEGVDIKTLDTVILATPQSRIIQSCGRILRKLKKDYEYNPLIIDITDQLGLFNSMARKRMTEYNMKYLKSDKSTLKYYKCSNETNYEIKFENSVNLHKKIEEKVFAKDHDFFNSDSDTE